jgi:pyruvate dehydrogenase E1 component beta subunit
MLPAVPLPHSRRFDRMSTQVDMRPVEAEETSTMTYREAVNLALHDALAGDDSVIFMGEDIASDGGVFKTNSGLMEAFGADRILNTPICENGFTGVALGMAVTGTRPIVEFMFADFLPTAGDAIVNQLPKYRFMSGGQCAVPVTLRVVSGGTGRFGTQHSATGESWFIGLPGLRVAVAGTPAGAYSLLLAAVRDSNPVLIHEHKGMYGIKGPVRRGEMATIGLASVERTGSDMTIVSSLLMVERSLRAAETLAGQGINAEVIDMRWVRPLDVDSVERSLAKTGRLLVVEEQVHAGGWGATLVSELVQRGVVLARPPVAVSLPADLPVPYSPGLEDLVISSVDRIVAAARTLAD